MHRLNVRSRTHPMAVDAGWAGLLSVVGLLHAAQFAGPQLAWRAASAVLLAVLLTVRRRVPGPAAAGGVLLGAGQLALGIAAAPTAAGYLVLAYTAAAYGPAWASRLALAGGVLAGPLAVRCFAPDELTDSWPRTALVSGFLSTPFVLCWAWGRLTRVRRAYLTELEDRAARLERERD
ncbi:sensor histidine kinase, partial [Kitasatospora sp. NPDC056651]